MEKRQSHYLCVCVWGGGGGGGVHCVCGVCLCVWGGTLCVCGGGRYTVCGGGGRYTVCVGCACVCGGVHFVCGGEGCTQYKHLWYVYAAMFVNTWSVCQFNCVKHLIVN